MLPANGSIGIQDTEQRMSTFKGPCKLEFGNMNMTPRTAASHADTFAQSVMNQAHPGYVDP